MSQNPNNRLPPTQRRSVRLKCLVLGAAQAGKTSLLRRYFHHKFDPVRMPTLGCDFYTSKVSTSVFSDTPSNGDHTTATIDSEDESTTTVWVSLQMWDTPGRERINFKRRRPSENTYSDWLGMDFFKQADAVMLVYDMTSSTSFTQLMKWYADLMDLQNTTGEKLPILIVANKLDLSKNQSEQERNNPRRTVVPKRDVMGLRGNFRGNDFRYEYQVSSHPKKTGFSEASLPSSTNAPRDRKKKKKSSLKQQNRRMEISSFLVNRENWTDDWSYLASLLVSEDQSHPDRDMVLLWCMRNGLTHCEASAATGEGVSEAVETLLRLAMDANKPSAQPDVPTIPLTRGRLDRLDLHQRYAVKEDHCCSQFVLRPVLQIFRQKDTR